MKVLRFTVIGYVIVFCSLVLMGSSNIEAVEYLGDFCFRAVGEIKPVEVDMKVAVVHMGNNHYSLYGKEVDNNGIETATHGNAEIRSDGRIVCTLVGSGKIDTEMWESTIHIEFDNLSNGRFHTISHIKEFGGPDSYERYEEGDITQIPCQ